MPPSHTTRTNKGFTLIEMMVTVVLMGILISMTVPLGSMVETFRLNYINQRLYASSALARSEAIKRGARVSICRSADSGTTCDPSNSNWSAGWVVFVNPNNNDAIDSGEEVIRVYNAVSSNLGITWNGGNRLTFIPRGSPEAEGRFTLCMGGRVGETLRHVNISPTGQIRKLTTTGNCLCDINGVCP